ncbi:TonB-dependent receptor (plasmid) [Pedobacter sp. BS3]|uniref:TonB-dependent receptor domain-containing protein n=1 Tax=Pedobacter sp. BS3 TaxID=2567937 RepID=UPI0011EC06B6|nr:TonB-dependent receptor [Pedobacter sp. BS3]TZF86043.1 TonB-dependent receptor [Pedobacter sp. BS3]
MTIRILHLLLCFLPVLLSATRSLADNGLLTGKVIDNKTGEVVDFAAVALFKQSDGSVVKSYQTENGGKFQFSNLPFDTYKIKISFVGYTSAIIENIVLSKQHPTKNLGTIKLKPDANVLNEVVVTDTKPVVQFGTDTITYNVSQSLMAEGSTASDVMRNVPMVDVDIDGKPTIAGKRNTRIFMDGKPSDYTAATLTDLLNVLPADAIEKIEVITNPDVQYAADGDGIINITLKKGYKIGLNGSVALTGGTLGTYNGSAYIAYRTDSLSISSSYGYINRPTTSDGVVNTTYYKNDAISSYRNQYSTNDNGNKGHNLRGNMDWDITPNQNVRVAANVNFRNTGGDSYLDDHSLDIKSVETKLIQQNNSNVNDGSSYNLDADYSLKLKNNKGTLKAGMVGFYNNNDRDRNLAREILTHSNGLLVKTRQYYNNVAANTGLDLNLNYYRPVTKLSSLSMGFQSSFHKNDNDQFVTGYNFDTLQDTVNSNLTNRFIYYENIYAVYASYSLRTKKRWSFRAGGRTELTDASFEQDKPATASMKPYINFFPNISLGKSFRKRYNVGISYSMRIARPRDYALNPLVDSSNTANIFYGNPALKPSYTHQVELSFGAFGQKWSFTPRLSYANSGHIIERIRMDTVSTYENVGSSNTYALNMFGNYRPTKKITFTGSFGVSRTTYESTFNLSKNTVGYSYRASVGPSIQFPKRIAFEGNVNYYNRASVQGRSKGSVSASFGARKGFLDNKLFVRVMSVDPFAQRRNIQFVEGINYTQERNSKLATRNYQLTVSYRFTKVGRNTVNKQKKDSSKAPETPISE